jgi:2-polyprenyl-3-methyl-5-hydroxy-6-metoxy-1,4-benzoquinol methylase
MNDLSKSLFFDSDSDFYDLEYCISLEYRYFSGAHRSRINNILETIAQATGLKCLDIGCGGGYFTNELKKTGADVIGIDYSLYAIEFAKRRFPSLDFRRISAYDLTSFSPASFDLVTLIDVVEHLENVSAALSNVYKVLKPAGRLIVSTDVENGVWSSHSLFARLMRQLETLSADGRASRLITKTESYRRKVVRDYHITHISPLSETAIIEMLVANNFRVVEHKIYPLVAVPLRDLTLKIFPKSWRGDHQCVLCKKMP